MTVAVAADKFTEADLLAALRYRFSYSGNGGSGRYAFLTHVRTGAAFEAQEIDAVMLCLWPSDQHSLMAFEVKVSRSDWLHEIKPDLSKSDRARRLCDSFTVVAPKGVVRREELPEGWGLYEAYRDSAGAVRVRTVVAPKPRPEKGDISRSFLTAILRAAGAVPGMTTGLKREPVGRVVYVHAVCECGHGQNEHYDADDDRDLSEPDPSFCEGCVEEKTQDEMHRFKEEKP